jgi:bifunctional non-homologous end joining protein LigD
MPGGVELSNLGKVFWPDEGLTKGNLIDYFDAIAPYLLPALRQRPLTVIRYPDGTKGMSFYQKNTPKYAPEWIKTISLQAESAKRQVRYTLCNDKRTLRWLANQASIELHPWLSRVDRLDRPDHLVFDLDPPQDSFERSVQVALVLKEVLDDIGLEGLPKTSGGKGIHVYVPLGRRDGYPAVRSAAVAIGQRVEERIPDEATSEFLKAKRGGRVFLDPGRNAPGAHVAAPYSPRARPGATVSFPVPWDELDRVKPGDFTIRNVPGLLAKEDPWRTLMPRPQTLPRELLREARAR